MTTLTTLDLDQLALVTGGACTCTPDSRQPGGPGGADPGAGAAPSAPPAGGGGGGFLAGLQGFLDFLQSPMFGKLVGGASTILSAFNTGNAGSAGASTQPDATAEA